MLSSSRILICLALLILSSNAITLRPFGLKNFLNQNTVLMAKTASPQTRLIEKIVGVNSRGAVSFIQTSVPIEEATNGGQGITNLLSLQTKTSESEKNKYFGGTTLDCELTQSCSKLVLPNGGSRNYCYPVVVCST